jgi:diaminohydroxyphosphoribosylaminopyrimidine deaminase/5-amino-6-(5-phosphoribosylamino)uracil reductase
MVADTDAVFMRRAFGLAERARGLTSPNPLVGAVLTNGERVLAEGFHRAAGCPHAEVEALAAIRDESRGATLYVTLEPCVHHGRTPPCVPRIIEAGVRRVVGAVADPNPLVSGRGFEALRAAGIDVLEGLLPGEARRQNRAFLTAMRKHRPHVTLKGAMTLDGKIADSRGTSQWITGDEARYRAHRLRSEADAIVVGIGTVLADDPRLSVRLDRPWPREPYRVVLDWFARTPPTARVIASQTPSRAIIAVGAGAPRDRVRALEAAGATVMPCSGADERVGLAGVLEELFAREVRAVLVEGGGAVHAGFVEEGLVDRVAVFVAPLLIGGRAAPSLLGGLGRRLDQAVRLDNFETRRLGQDLLIEADVV